MAAFAQKGVFYALTSARHGDHSTAFEFAIDVINAYRRLNGLYDVFVEDTADTAAVN